MVTDDSVFSCDGVGEDRQEEGCVRPDQSQRVLNMGGGDYIRVIDPSILIDSDSESRDLTERVPESRTSHIGLLLYLERPRSRLPRRRGT